MASIVLGIMGKKRSGKDTFAARLVSEHGYTRLAFADALKASLLELDPKIHETVRPRSGKVVATRLSEIVVRFGWEKAKQLHEVRRLLQRHGVAMRNHVDEDVWVKPIERKIRETAGPVVITDVRFENEADLVEWTFDGYLIRVFRSGLESSDAHISETALDDREADFDVFNDASIDSLRMRADRIARFIADNYI